MSTPSSPGIDAATLADLRGAMLPMDGSIADHAEAILAAFADLVPRESWRELTYVDLTAGSCLLPLAFAAAGVQRIVINDIAVRSIVAARALFGPVGPDQQLIRDALEGRLPMRPHQPSARILADYLTASICDHFDRLFFADVAAPKRDALRYVALRFVLGFARNLADGFAILPTHDPRQLLDENDPDRDAWRAYFTRAESPLAVLNEEAGRIHRGRERLITRKADLSHADMRDVAARIDYGDVCFAAVNPPTNGVDEYAIDDQVPHSLIANRLVPLTRSRESAAQFWTTCVEAALAALPGGAHYLVWGGDGVLDVASCHAVWRRFGEPQHVATVTLEDGRAPHWAIYRKT
jgi:hypothetical protein